MSSLWFCYGLFLGEVVAFRTLKDDVMEYFTGRGFLAMVLVFLACLLLAGRLIYLQLFKYDELTDLSEKNRIRVMRVRADRGFIKDRNMLLLVKNAPAYELELIKEDTPNSEETLKQVANVIPMDIEAVHTRVRNSAPYEAVRIARGLKFEDISHILEFSDNYPGVQIVTAPMRSYHDSYILSHMMGYIAEVSEDEAKLEGYKSGFVIGKSGLEKQYETDLRGRDGSMRVEVDHVGRIMKTLSEDPPVPGKNLVLSIDFRIQEYLAQLMDGRQGAAVVLDGNDGSLLALYSAPNYDLDMFNPFLSEEYWNTLRNDPRKPLLNRTVEGAYPPGSTYKILVAAAGLMEGLIDVNTKYYCGGSYKFTPRSNIVHNCWKKGGHGEISLLNALSESCDVYFYNLGVALGIDKLHEYSTTLGLGHMTGVALPNEKTGVFPSKGWKLQYRKEPWYPGETVNISIGQGYTTTTPLQLAVMVSSVFGGGRVYEPRIALALEDQLSGELTPLEPRSTQEIEIPEDVRKLVMKGLVMGVERRGGTAWRARVPGVSIGGKTGTAQVVSLKWVENMEEAEIPEHFRDHSWFTGIYPADNPRYTVVIMLEHGGSGGKSSAPVGGALIKHMVELGYAGNN
jgi:penicillin-binding protein 2